jgi:hypothetical protein
MESRAERIRAAISRGDHQPPGEIGDVEELRQAKNRQAAADLMKKELAEPDDGIP